MHERGIMRATYLYIRDISPRRYEVCPVCEDHLGEVFLLSGEVPLQPREQRRPEHVVKLLPVHAALPLQKICN